MGVRGLLQGLQQMLLKSSEQFERIRQSKAVQGTYLCFSFQPFDMKLCLSASCYIADQIGANEITQSFGVTNSLMNTTSIPQEGQFSGGRAAQDMSRQLIQ